MESRFLPEIPDPHLRGYATGPRGHRRPCGFGRLPTSSAAYGLPTVIRTTDWSGNETPAERVATDLVAVPDAVTV
jgi:hypothetical protein